MDEDDDLDGHDLDDKPYDPNGAARDLEDATIDLLSAMNDIYASSDLFRLITEIILEVFPLSEQSPDRQGDVFRKRLQAISRPEIGNDPFLPSESESRAFEQFRRDVSFEELRNAFNKLHVSTDNISKLSKLLNESERPIEVLLSGKGSEKPDGRFLWT